MLRGAHHELPPRFAAMARFAVELTGAPWALPRTTVDDLTAQGLDARDLEAAVGVVAMFNYLNCVADATGIELDYATQLPAFEPDHDRVPAVRPPRDAWPVVPGELRGFSRLSAMSRVWQQWHEYVFDSDEPLGHRERRLLARAAAEESCDRWLADSLGDYEPKNDAESRLVEFGRKLSRTPWRMGPADLELLRAAGYPEPALLHIIAVVALQHAESRLAMGLAAVRS